MHIQGRRDSIPRDEEAAPGDSEPNTGSVLDEAAHEQQLPQLATAAAAQQLPQLAP